MLPKLIQNQNQFPAVHSLLGTMLLQLCPDAGCAQGTRRPLSGEHGHPTRAGVAMNDAFPSSCLHVAASSPQAGKPKHLLPTFQQRWAQKSLCLVRCPSAPISKLQYITLELSFCKCYLREPRSVHISRADPCSTCVVLPCSPLADGVLKASRTQNSRGPRGTGAQPDPK